MDRRDILRGAAVAPLALVGAGAAQVDLGRDYWDGRLVDRFFPIMVTDQATGRSAWIEIVGGRLVHGGDLPTDEAARIFLGAMAEQLEELRRRGEVGGSD